MKFPNHILLDVSRPTSVHPLFKRSWHFFYKQTFLSTTSRSTVTPIYKANTPRIVVTSGHVYTVSPQQASHVKTFFQQLALKHPGGAALSSKRLVRCYLPNKSSFNKSEIVKLTNQVKSLKEREPTKLSGNYLKLNTQLNFYKSLVDAKNASWVRGYAKENLFRDKNLSFSLNRTGERFIYKSFLKRTRRDFQLLRKLVDKVSSQPQDFATTKESFCRPVSSGSRRGKPNYNFCFSNYTVSLSERQYQIAQWQYLLATNQVSQPKKSTLRDTFDIHFLLKERHYSKLKYSKTAERDMVSSGSAALLAGFIGFLISEKFGIELVDSGDFYIALMEFVFACFALKAYVDGLDGYLTNYNGTNDPYAFKHGPHKLLVVWSNFFVYLTMLYLMFLRSCIGLLRSAFRGMWLVFLYFHSSK